MAEEMTPASAGCAGKPDGTPCPGGGRCLHGECWYAVKTIADAGESCTGKANGTRLSSGLICWEGQAYSRKRPDLRGRDG